MKAPRLGAIALITMLCFFLALILSASAWAYTTGEKKAIPGTLNYVEGQVSLGKQLLSSSSVGTAALRPGELLTSGNGKAEVLLTPGVFLRVGNHTSVAMISPNLENTEIGIISGHAMVEVDQIFPENDILVTQGDATIRLLKTGLYDFDRRQAELRVFDGKAFVEDDGGELTVKGGHEVSFAPNARFKFIGFDRNDYEEDSLYRWSSLRSAYVAEANMNAAELYANDGDGPWGPGWWGAGWYWDLWFSAFTFVPRDGISYSSFGWGFYSPSWVSHAPLYGFGVVYPHRSIHHHFSIDYQAWGGPTYLDRSNYVRGIYKGPGSTARGFQSGPQMVGRASGFGAGGLSSGELGSSGLGSHAGRVGGGGLHNSDFRENFGRGHSSKTLYWLTNFPCRFRAVRAALYRT